MAKTIKFNLICDGKSIRTLEDLKENFVVEDVLRYYENSLLHRWLVVRGYKEQAEKVEQINTESAVDKIVELAEIFSVTDDIKKVKEAAYIFEYEEKRKQQYEKYEQEKREIEQIIGDFKKGYNELVDAILADPKNIVLIKANIQEIMNNYKWIFGLNHRNLFNIFWDNAQLAILCLVMNEHARNYYLPIDMVDENGKVFLDIDNKACEDKRIMYQKIVAMIGNVNFKKNFENYIKSCSDRTEGYWKDIENSGKQYMIISMGRGDWIRPYNTFKGDMSFYDVNNKFVIVDGIQYKSNSDSDELIYMEV